MALKQNTLLFWGAMQLGVIDSSIYTGCWGDTASNLTTRPLISLSKLSSFDRFQVLTNQR